MKQVARWRIVTAGVWLLLATTTWLVARLDPDFHPCRTSTTSADASRSVETQRRADDEVKASKTVESPATTETTRICEPVGAIELAVLLVPALVLIAPALESVNLLGLLGFSLRELEQRFKAETRELVIRIVQEREEGEKTERSVTADPETFENLRTER